MHTLLLQRKSIDPLLNIRNLQVLDCLYKPAPIANMIAAAPEILNVDDHIDWKDLDTVTPPCAWIIQNGSLVLWVGGTSGNIHLPQLLNGWASVYDDWQSSYGASGAFFNAAMAIKNAMDPMELATVDHAYLIGHSYGGACCEALGAVLRGAGITDIRIWSYGSPRPGLFRLGTILAGMQNTRFFTDDDPVRFIPPHSSEVPALTAVESAPLVMGCNTQVQPPTGYQILQNGQIEETEGNPTVLNAVAFSIGAWVMDLNGFRSVNHGIANYLTRFQSALAASMPPLEYPGSRPREQPEVLTVRQREQIADTGRSIVDASLAVTPNINSAYPVVSFPVGSTQRYRRRRVGRVWGVKLGDEVVALGPGKRDALRLARAYNRAAVRD